MVAVTKIKAASETDLIFSIKPETFVTKVKLIYEMMVNEAECGFWTVNTKTQKMLSRSPQMTLLFQGCKTDV